ncbi:EpsG family protein [Photobacterium leiognathi]|uniref:EpsG family protein n=1 Tax=Photobacterium leiognathi TaxID=553611 RepID=UPI0029814517|nr:EpsG family protein [Photobacterium leiognathi]
MVEIIIPLVLILLSTIEFFQKEKMNVNYNIVAKKQLCYLFFIFYIVVFSLRYKVGVDWYNYKTYFENSLYSNDYEIGFKLLNIILNKSGFDYWSVSFIASLIFIIFFLYRVYKDFDYPVIFSSWFLLLSLMNQLETVRLFLALSFLFIAIGYVKNKKNIYGYISIIIGGVLFHKTLLLYLVIMPLIDSNIKNRTRIVIVFSSLIFAFLIKPFQEHLIDFMKWISLYIKDDRFIFYLNQLDLNNLVSPITITYILKISLFLFVLYFLTDDNEFTKKNKIYLNIGVIYFLTINLLSFFPTIVYRVSDLFVFGYIGSLIGILYIDSRLIFKYINLCVILILFTAIYFRPFSDDYYKNNIINYNNYIIYLINGNDHYQRNLEVKRFWKYE